MTDDDIRAEVEGLADRVEKIEANQDRLQKLPDAVSRLEGAVGALTRLTTSRFDNVDRGVSKASSWDTIIKFAATVVVPIVVSLVTGYFLLKAGLAGAGSPK